MATSAQIIRRARERAGLTQIELALRSGIAQSSISAYERGAHLPSVETLRALVGAAGQRMNLGLEAAPERVSGTARGTLDLLRSRREELLAAGEALGVRAVYVFGSVVRGEDGPDSDVDLLVELASPLGYLGLARIEEAFSAIVGRRVEIVPMYALVSEASKGLRNGAVPL
jgi:predicted nucleotidyltransferase/DNA-binding XRE family transcriptional regulator